MSKYGVNVPPGVPVFSIDEVDEAVKKMKSSDGKVGDLEYHQRSLAENEMHRQDVHTYLMRRKHVFCSKQLSKKRPTGLCLEKLFKLDLIA